MTLPDLKPEQNLPQEFAPREVFLEQYREFFDQLAGLEGKTRLGLKQGYTKLEKRRAPEEGSQKLSQLIPAGDPDTYVLWFLQHLFEFKHKIGHYGNDVHRLAFDAMITRYQREWTLEMMGPPGMGQKELARAIAGATFAELESEAHSPISNPFSRSQQDDYALRRELFSLFTGITASIGLGKRDGKWVSETSTWEHALIDERAKAMLGVIDPQEDEVYQRTFAMIRDFVPPSNTLTSVLSQDPKKNMLLVLMPTSLDIYTQAMQASGLSREDLSIYIQCTEEAISQVPDCVGVHVVTLDPLELRTSEEFQQSIVDEVLSFVPKNIEKIHEQKKFGI